MNTPQACLGDVVTVLEAAYPPGSAQNWDQVGLVVGDPGEPVSKVFLAVDPVDDVVTEAIEWGADLIIVHHPLFLRGVNSVATTDAKGRIAHRLIRAGCALYTAHTNADAAIGGASDQIARLLGLVNTRALIPGAAAALDKFVVFTPTEFTAGIKKAMALAGAGALGKYSECAWVSKGEGTFIPGEGSNPTIGEAGKKTLIDEDRLEMIASRKRRSAVLAAMRSSHPYEEPAFDVLELAQIDSATGLGRIGTVPKLSLQDLALQVAKVLPPTVQGVRVSGPLDAQIETVAICSGSGDSLFAEVWASGADVYITADLRHHPASEAREASGNGPPYLIDVSHYASEWPWLLDAREVLERAVEVGTLQQLEFHTSTLSTDPWTAHFPSR